MNNTSYRTSRDMAGMLKRIPLRRGAAWGLMILGALLAFEIFNYSTTEFALNDVLGDLRFLGVQWATILSIAFCGIDFAGIARLFTPEKGRDEPAEVWYLFGAWLLAAAMNAMLTWWGVSVAIVNHSSLAGGVVVSDATLTRVIPIFVAVMVWLIRVLIIGAFSVAGERLFSQMDERQHFRPAIQKPASISSPAGRQRPVINTPLGSAMRPASKIARPQEPTYHNLSYNTRSSHEPEYTEINRSS
ncbi:MAG: hypothetical protein FJZ96_02100 [Chloroflexi bacterium]|nr:hypothetical protein [Chloroflexota bacterium]